jgi:hypothetical protein
MARWAEDPTAPEMSAGFDPAQESSWLPNRFCYFVLAGASIESEHNDEMLAENKRIVWAAVSERTCLCRMHMTRS